MRLLNQKKFTASGKTIAVLLSGGVDSSVTAWLLQQDGWNVVGVYMKIPTTGGAITDNTSAMMAAEKLTIPLYEIDVTEIFQQQVILPFRQSYQNGETPNPCVDCNQNLKFGFVWEKIRAELSINHLATGHYAQTITIDDKTFLRCAQFTEKDQSYFIYAIPPQQLPFLHLPLGKSRKNETRIIAEKIGLPSAQTAESMELCFADGGDYRHALSLEENIEGDFCNIDGEKIGTHNGVMNYTIGQRKLGVSLGATPHYVLQILPAKNQIIVGTYEQALKTEVNANLRVIHQPEKLFVGAKLCGKIRSGAAFHHGEIIYADEKTMRVKFIKPIFAPTVGQHLVVYDDEQTIVAGGVIS